MKPVIPRGRSLAERLALIQARNRRGLGDVPHDVGMNQLATPPILNAREAHPKDGKGMTLLDYASALLARIGRHDMTLSNYRLEVGTVPVQLFPYNPARGYWIVVNNGANVVRLGMGREADLISGLPIAATGGFYEPIWGGISSVSAIAAAGPNELIIIEGFYANLWG